jgi:hypothetical protein
MEIQKPTHLIFEGADLAGKSWLMSRIYDYLEPKYNQSKFVLDGCHWFNCDNGIFGTEYGAAAIASYLGVFEVMRDKNIIVEKFHLADIVLSRMFRRSEEDRDMVGQALKGLGFKLVLVTFKEDQGLIEQRIKDRLKLYPHYKRIQQEPGWYMRQQHEYIKEAERSPLPFLKVKTDKLPDERPVEEILSWIRKEE